MINRILYLILLIVSTAIIHSCNSDDAMLSTKKIYLTSESGDKIAEKENVNFVSGNADGTVIKIYPDNVKQTIDGIGSSFTESSAYVLAHLDPDTRREIMEQLFSEKGANFSLARTHIGACDFCVEGKYSYVDTKGDVKLESFSLEPDTRGFSSAEYPGIADESYDLLPMIKEALDIKSRQDDGELRIVASAWTAPSWMKDIDDWYISGSPENNYQGTGGSLKPEYEEAYADYLIKYLDTYRSENVDIWGLTPVNEPHGNNGQWESMHFTPETQNEFIKNYLGPKLKEGDNADVRLLIYDQNRDGLEHWTDVILGDSVETQNMFTELQFTGTKVHSRYMRTYLTGLMKSFLTKAILHTEGCIDDLGKPAPAGITDPENFRKKTGSTTILSGGIRMQQIGDIQLPGKV